MARFEFPCGTQWLSSPSISAVEVITKSLEDVPPGIFLTQFIEESPLSLEDPRLVLYTDDVGQRE